MVSWIMKGYITLPSFFGFTDLRVCIRTYELSERHQEHIFKASGIFMVECIVKFYKVPDQYLHPLIAAGLVCVSWGTSGDCHWPWKASLCTEPVQQDRYQGYPSHEDVQMPSSSDTPSECLQLHLDQENLKTVRKTLSLKQVPAQVSTHQKCFHQIKHVI